MLIAHTGQLWLILIDYDNFSFDWFFDSGLKVPIGKNHQLNLEDHDVDQLGNELELFEIVYFSTFLMYPKVHIQV